MNEPQITLIGNAGSDAQLRFTPSGQAVANFSLAVTPRKKVGDQWEVGETNWYRVNVWRDQAENVAESVEKGARVVVVGRLSLRKYEQDGQERLSVEVTADEVAVSLRRATAKVQKVERKDGSAASSKTADYESGEPWANDEEPF